MALDASDTRLNKFISETGMVSRREADRLIEAGQVKVNGRRAEMGMRVSDTDRVTVRGKPLRPKPRRVYLVYNKPVGVTCTTDPADPTNIVKAVNYPERIFPIGRLDKPSQGLILLTNDGDIVNKILRAGNAHEKEYQVRVDRPIDARFIERMGGGIPILGTVTQRCPVRQTGPDSFTIVLTQGLNRQIRRMTEYLGYEVTYLKRVRLMNIRLTGLSSGEWRELGREEMATLEAMLGDSRKTEDASLPKRKVRPAKQGSGRQGSGKPGAGKTGSGKQGTGKPGAGGSGTAKPGTKRAAGTGTRKPGQGASPQEKSGQGKPGQGKLAARPKRSIKQAGKPGVGKPGEGQGAKPKRAIKQAGKSGAGKPAGKGGQDKAGFSKNGPGKAGGRPARRSPRGRS